MRLFHSMIDLLVRLLFSFHSFFYFCFVFCFPVSLGWMRKKTPNINSRLNSAVESVVRCCIVNIKLNQILFLNWISRAKLFLVQQTLVVSCNLYFSLCMCLPVCQRRTKIPIQCFPSNNWRTYFVYLFTGKDMESICIFNSCYRPCLSVLKCANEIQSEKFCPLFCTFALSRSRSHFFPPLEKKHPLIHFSRKMWLRLNEFEWKAINGKVPHIQQHCENTYEQFQLEIVC